MTSKRGATANHAIKSSDLGTPELSHRTKLQIEPAEVRGFRVRARRIDQTTIDILLHQRLISLDQHSAGERLQQMIWITGLSGVAATNPDRVTTHQPATEPTRLAILVRLGGLLARLSRRCGVESLAIVRDACCGQRNLTSRDFRRVVMGLDFLIGEFSRR